MKNRIKKSIKIILSPIINYRNQKIKEKKQELKDSPQKLAEYLYRKNFHRSINWHNPKELNEKIRWIQFNTDISIWTLLADKYKAREFVKSKGLSNILVELYGVWDDVDEIDFNLLPQQFVIKTNHGCGEVILVKDKSKANIQSIKDSLRKYMNTTFGYEHAETHYIDIPRKIIAEKLLENSSSFSSSIVDYKFYCCNGKPYVCGVFFNRNIDSHQTWSSFYDMNWVRHPDWRNKWIEGGQKDVPCPVTFDYMKRVCQILCKDIPFCRLDLYESNDRLYFGEFTFTPAVCSGGSMSKKLCYELGEILNLSKFNN